MTLARHRNRLRQVLATALAASPAHDRVLDACGSWAMRRSSSGRWVSTSSRWTSPPICSRSIERKASAAGLTATVEVGEIASFLSTSRDLWDVVVFSSALHHLDDYRGVLDAVRERLAPGGVIVTVFDPIAAGKLAQVIRYADYLLWLAVTRPRAFLGRLGHRAVRAGSSSDSVGRLARACPDGDRRHRLSQRLRRRRLGGRSPRAVLRSAVRGDAGSASSLAQPTAFAFVVRRST